jgi:hypothetical protein
MTLPSIPRRLGLAAAGLATLGGGTLLAVGSAGAYEVPCDPNDPGPIIELCEGGTLTSLVPLPPDLGLDDLDADGPTITVPPGLSIPIPGDDDGPTITIPPGGSLPIPGGDDDGPTITIPPGGSLPIPGDDGPADDTPVDQPDTPVDQPDAPVDQPTDPPVETTAPPVADGPSQQPESPGQAGLLLPAVRISEAVVACDGGVRVVYETSADPALSAEAEHVVSVSPLRVPAVAMTQRLVQQPLNGAFTATIAAPADDYRVFLLVDFEPANPDDVVLADEATAPAPTDCPAG